jgi:sirohydrochlorin ferrochelatase
MKILLLVAHGSRREESNLEGEALSKTMIKYNANDFDKIMPAFLEFASPSIPEAIKKCSEIGASNVTVLPYFLSAGVHINRDIPGEVKDASEGFPNLNITISNYFGSRDEIAELLMKTALDVT